MQTEGNASLRVLSYAETIEDPLLREAVEIDGFEETRHKQVLSNLVQAYGIPLAPEPEYLRPRHPEWAFLLAGFCECVDTFVAFGLFALAERSGFFAPALVDTFEPVVQEEGRHILFFVNWVAWHRRNLPLWLELDPENETVGSDLPSRPNNAPDHSRLANQTTRPIICARSATTS
jgi:hypothetical protein